jgi:signal transduction histidine kinase
MAMNPAVEIAAPSQCVESSGPTPPELAVGQRTGRGNALIPLRNAWALLCAVLVVGLISIVWIRWNGQKQLVSEISAEHAKAYSNMLRAVRSIYTSEVVSRVKAGGLEVRPDYHDNQKAIPLPATFAKLIAERVGADERGFSAELYSPYPFPSRDEGGLRDAFARDAWDALNADKSQPFLRNEEIGGERLARLATADVMERSCVQCHNSHPASPKRDWQIGDVRGILEVRVPLNQSESQATAGIHQLIGLMGPLLFCFVVAAALILRRMRRIATELETAVEDRTRDLEQQIIVAHGAGQRLAEEADRRAQVETELLAAQKLESVGRLAAGVAHEINTPVQFANDSVYFVRDSMPDLFGMVDRLLAAARTSAAGSIDEESAVEQAQRDADWPYLVDNVPKALDRAIEGLDRVATIVRSMKEFAHPDQPDMVAVDLNRAIESTLTVARNEYKYVADVKLELGELPDVTCHAGEINQVILNLIVNAAHAIADVVEGTDRRGEIHVRTWQEGESVVISIRDTGGGIPEHVRSRIFEPFFTTKEVGRGTGQGLAIARNVVVQKHGGQLTFETCDGQGTAFYVRLPVQGANCTQYAVEV